MSRSNKGQRRTCFGGPDCDWCIGNRVHKHDRQSPVVQSDEVDFMAWDALVISELQLPSEMLEGEAGSRSSAELHARMRLK